MVRMYNTKSGYQPSTYFKLLNKPDERSWDSLNRKEFDNRKHWLCFNLSEVNKTFNVYYPLNVLNGEKITILIDTNTYIDEWDVGLEVVEWIEGKSGLFQQKIQPILRAWIEKMSKKTQERTS